MVTLSASFEGTLLADSAVTWTAEPAGAVMFLGGGIATLAQVGQVTLSAHAAVGTGERTITVATPPTIVFDLLRDGNRDIYRVALDGGDLARLTTDPGDDGDPTAVGDRVVFVSYRDGNGELYATSLSGGAPTRLTFTDVAEAGPALSRDGAWLAYTRTDGGVPKLWVSLSNGGGASPGHRELRVRGLDRGEPVLGSERGSSGLRVHVRGDGGPVHLCGIHWSVRPARAGLGGARGGGARVESRWRVGGVCDRPPRRYRDLPARGRDGRAASPDQSSR